MFSLKEIKRRTTKQSARLGVDEFLVKVALELSVDCRLDGFLCTPPSEIGTVLSFPISVLCDVHSFEWEKDESIKNREKVERAKGLT